MNKQTHPKLPHFSRYLDAWTFCRAHNLSMAAIHRTGHWSHTVFVDDMLVVAQTAKPLPPIPAWLKK